MRGRLELDALLPPFSFKTTDQHPMPGQERRTAMNVLPSRMGILMNVLLLVPVGDPVGVNEGRFGVESNESGSQALALAGGHFGCVSTDAITQSHRRSPPP